MPRAIRQRTALVLVTASLVAAALFLISAVKSSMPPKCVGFTVISTSLSNGVPRQVLVAVSNVSDSPLLCNFMADMKSPWFEVAYTTNGAWHDDVILSFGGGSGIIPPHQAEKGAIAIPDGATKLRIGLHITSLTWRGRLAWKTLDTTNSRLRSLTGFLMAMDLRNRSRTEWTKESSVASLGATNDPTGRAPNR